MDKTKKLTPCNITIISKAIAKLLPKPSLNYANARKIWTGLDNKTRDILLMSNHYDSRNCLNDINRMFKIGN